MGRRHKIEPKVRPLEPQARRRKVSANRKLIGSAALLAVVAVAGVVWINSRGSDAMDLTAVPIGPADEFPLGLVREVVLDVGYSDTVGVENPAPDLPSAQEVQQTRLFVVNLPGKGLVAMSQRSPFRGCRLVEIDPAEATAMLGPGPQGFGGGFFDPCHGGLFGLDGTHRAGPGQQNLTAFAVARDTEGTVTIDLTSVHTIGTVAG